MPTERRPIALLMSDVVGSTRLEQAHGPHFLAWLQQHVDLAVRIANENHGKVLKHRGEGDSIFAAFERPEDAVSAALAFQLGLPLLDGAPEAILVRMAVDYGDAHALDSDYWGGVVNRCARLREIAHGGQILVSQAARRASPHTFVDLGLHRLRDVDGPIEIFQVRADGLREDFPPIRNPLHLAQLPSYGSSFVGRFEERALTRRLIADHRLVSILGPGGSGKTRLGVEVASRATTEVIHLDLASAQSEASIRQALANRIDPEHGEPSAEELAEKLSARPCLVVLDNADGDIAATREVVSNLLTATQAPRFLITSREPLGIPGEQRVVLGSLGSDASLLLLDRASAAGASPNTDPALVTDLANSVDGLPLGIELLAPMLAAMPPAQVAALVQQYTALDLRAANAEDRHSSLVGVLAGSCDRLTDSSRERLFALGLFASPFTLESVAATWGETIWQAAQSMRELVEKSLVQVEAVGDQSGRYRLLSTTASYVRRFDPDSEMKVRFCEFEAGLGEKLDTNIRADQNHETFRAWDAERPNVMAALPYANTAQALRLIHSLQHTFMWRAGGHVLAKFAKQRTQEVMTMPPSVERAQFFNDLMTLEIRAGNLGEAKAAGELAIKDAEARGDGLLRAKTLVNLALAVVRADGSRTEAIEYCEEAIRLYEEAGDKKTLALVLSNLATLRDKDDNLPLAILDLERSVALLAEEGANASLVLVLQNLAEVLMRQGKERVAFRHLIRAAILADELEMSNYSGQIAAISAVALLRLGKPGIAGKLWSYMKTQDLSQIIRDSKIEDYYREESLELQRLAPTVINFSGKLADLLSQQEI